MCERLWLSCKVDNTQAITAVTNGYFQRLRHLARTQRMSIGIITEMIEDADKKVAVTLVPHS